LVVLAGGIAKQLVWMAGPLEDSRMYLRQLHQMTSTLQEISAQLKGSATK
jgi:hypothetical protein